MSEPKKLTDPPTNLKEAIDWLAMVGGYGLSGWDIQKQRKFDDNTEGLTGWKEAKQKSGIVNIQGVVKSLGSTLGSRFLGYVSQNDNDFSGNSGIIKSDGHYRSTYKDFTWEDSRIHDYLKMTLCAAAMAFLGLSYMYHQCKITHGWGTNKLTGSDVNSGLGPFMKDMGYGPEYLNGNKNGSAVASLMEDRIHQKFDGLATPEEWSPYSDFLQNLEHEYTTPSKNAVDHPLTASYIAAKHYFTLHFAKDETSDETLKAIKANLEAFKKSCGLLYGDLKAEISTLLPNVTVTDKSAVSESDTASTSPAGAVAGTLTTIGLGGAAAAYVFNLGGAKPFVNGLLRIG